MRKDAPFKRPRALCTGAFLCLSTHGQIRRNRLTLKVECVVINLIKIFDFLNQISA
jgi:hypothetical protein